MVSSERNAQMLWPPWRLILVVLNLLALIVSVVLSWHFLKGGSMVGCGGGSACEQVLNSKWSTIAGVLPVSSLAMGLYLAMLVAAFFTGTDTEIQIRKLAWKILLLMAGLIAGSAVWFIIVQKWFIGEFCPYCMTEHITGLLLAAIIFLRGKKIIRNNAVGFSTNDQNHSTLVKRRFRIGVTGLILTGLLMSGIFATAQVIFTPKTVYQTGKSQDNLINIDYNTAPIIGSPDATYIVKLLFDYQCPHCQRIHFMLSEAVDKYKGKLAFVLCPAPLNTQCNPYISRDVDAFKNSCELARTGLAIWAAKREAYADFENWMFTFETGDRWKPRSLEDVRTKAIALIGEEKLNEASNSDWVNKYMQSSVQLYGQTMQDGKGGIPRLVYGSNWVIPEADGEDDFVKILQKSLGVPQP